jgi:hypothetical protein
MCQTMLSTEQQQQQNSDSKIYWNKATIDDPRSFINVLVPPFRNDTNEGFW